MAQEIPKEWKPAGAGEEEIDFTLYDLTASGTTPSATLTFFNHNRGTDGLAVTNMELAGQLPATQRFLIKKMQLLVDVEAAAGDSADVLDAAVAELYINNKLMYSIPAAVLATGVTPSQTTTATVGPAVNMYEFEFDKAIVLNGGVPFKVSMLIGKTAVSASTDLTYMLRGRLVRPAS
jgi:hypothetical protein